MDFSTSQRALQSLQRRTPTLSPKIKSLAADILDILGRGNNSPDGGGTGNDDDALLLSDPSSSIDLITQLLHIGTHGEPDGEGEGEARWEPLAVGLHLTTSLLQQLTLSHAKSHKNTNPAEAAEVYMDGPRVPTITKGGDDDNHDKNDGGDEMSVFVSVKSDQLIPFCENIMTLCHTHLEHKEPRIRSLVAKVVGQHAKLATTLTTMTTKSASDKLDTETETETETETNIEIETGNLLIDQSINLYQSILSSLYEHLKHGRTEQDTKDKSKSSEGALDDTTGWRALETNLFGIGSFIHSSAGRYFDYCARSCGTNGEGLTVVDEQLLQSVEYCCITHINRHVRAAGINVLEQMIHACTKNENKHEYGRYMHLLLDPESHLRNTIITVLKTTLSDNWSQVRMAASVLCRVFYVAMLDFCDQYESKTYELQSSQTNLALDALILERDTWLNSTYPLLLPRMCLNRFYLAQGVKLYSHETWRILFDRNHRQNDNGSIGAGDGLESVAMNAGPVCRYYVKMCDADNHVVREAACQAVAELASKIGRREEYTDCLAPYVVTLLQALLMCFHDESWPVRDEACLACGTFCLAYPAECEPELPTLFERWAEQLTDQIWSVREDAAVALGDAIEAYGQPMMDKVMEVLRRDLSSAKTQPAMTRDEYKRRQNDIDSHTNSQLYSCGSLAPKLRKGGAARIGCSSCDVNRPKAPWEATDGCIYLIRELTLRLCSNTSPSLGDISLTDDILLPILTELVDSCRVKHFPQSDDLRTTLWRNLPIIANALGKQRFKRTYLHLFMDMMIDNLDEKSHASQLSVHAAGQCAEELSSLVGQGVFRGRLEEEWQRDILDRVLEERRNMARMMPAEGFSPFGPAEAMLAVGGGAMIGGTAGGSGVGPKSRKVGVSGSGGGGATTSVFSAATRKTNLQLPVPGSGMVDAL